MAISITSFAPVEIPAAGNCAVAATALEVEVTALFDRLHDPLLRYLMSLRTPIADAEEIVQEVFLALFRHLRNGKPQTNLPAWTFAVAHNLALKGRMRKQREAPGVGTDIADPGAGPEESASANQRQRQLMSVVTALPEQDRCCLSLRAEGLRYREIAAVLGISLGGVANSLERSISRLLRADEFRRPYGQR